MAGKVVGWYLRKLLRSVGVILTAFGKGAADLMNAPQRFLRAWGIGKAARAEPLRSSPAKRGNSNSARTHAVLADKRDVDPPVLPPLVLDLGDLDGADFGGVADMRPATGLQVDAGDLQQAHPPGAARRRPGPQCPRRAPPRRADAGRYACASAGDAAPSRSPR